MAKYSSAFTSPVVFSPQQQSNGLSEVVSNLGLSQFHVAETEKYAHVTFFFNGGREEPFSGEVREMKESPKVATYDLEPKMAAEPVADAMVREVEAGVHALLVCNLAPPDMVTAATPVPALHLHLHHLHHRHLHHHPLHHHHIHHHHIHHHYIHHTHHIHTHHFLPTPCAGGPHGHDGQGHRGNDTHGHVHRQDPRRVHQGARYPKRPRPDSTMPAAARAPS